MDEIFESKLTNVKRALNNASISASEFASENIINLVNSVIKADREADGHNVVYDDDDESYSITIPLTTLYGFVPGDIERFDVSKAYYYPEDEDLYLEDSVGYTHHFNDLLPAYQLSLMDVLLKMTK